MSDSKPVFVGEERLREAAKYGFRRALIPKGNASGMKSLAIELIPVATVTEALDRCRELED